MSKILKRLIKTSLFSQRFGSVLWMPVSGLRFVLSDSTNIRHQLLLDAASRNRQSTQGKFPSIFFSYIFSYIIFKIVPNARKGFYIRAIFFFLKKVSTESFILALPMEFPAYLALFRFNHNFFPFALKNVTLSRLLRIFYSFLHFSFVRNHFFLVYVFFFDYFIYFKVGVIYFFTHFPLSKP